MRPYFWLFLGLGAVNSILVQDAASSKRLELIQKDIGFFPGNQLPDQDHVAQKDLESFNKDAHVNKQLARSNLVEEEEASAEENSLLKPLGKKETRIGNSKFNDMPCWDLRAYICSYPIQ
ncbi:hypothetical protein Baya_5875 [Bagarius yarrelli]|uniref:Uncharacterized protein n=1 Tax=Bagarius yarrelli TaxID=175774 RepID=A0A556TXR8_BAGYA|nr:hypothetical protein Baya_5875 [Bagarius yarrelli]